MNSNPTVLAAAIPFLIAMVLASRAAPREVRRWWLAFWWAVLTPIALSTIGTAAAITYGAARIWLDAFILGTSAAAFVLLYAAVLSITSAPRPTGLVARWVAIAMAVAIVTRMAAGALLGSTSENANVELVALPGRVLLTVLCFGVVFAGGRSRRRSRVRVPGIRMALLGAGAFGFRQLTGIVAALAGGTGNGLPQIQSSLSVLAVYFLGFGSLVVLLSYAREFALARERAFQRDERWRALGQMAAGIAHDFSNILTVIGPSVQMARDDAASGDPELPTLSDIEASSARAQELVAQLMSFAKSGEIDRGEAEMRETLSAQQRMLARLLSASITLDVHLPADPIRASISPARVSQVLLNLVMNARDAMATGGRITLRVNEEQFLRPRTTRTSELGSGRWVMLEVTDQGHGIAAEVLDRMFEPFFSTKAGSGTGLGLATVHQIVHEAGGAIEVSSIVGRGTTFRCWFPAARGRIIL